MMERGVRGDESEDERVEGEYRGRGEESEDERVEGEYRGRGEAEGEYPIKSVYFDILTLHECPHHANSSI